MSNTIGFDESFYLSQNPDVAAAVSRGVFASGAQHYQLNGRFEGRNPNAFFNTSFYLGTYPDVAKAGINPLTHFLNNGAAEGRFANAAEKNAIDLNNNGGADDFNEAAYRTTYSDVDAAIKAGTFKNAYQHFVQFGQFEGRVATLANGTTVTGPFGNAGATGSSLVLTTGVDNIVGTTGNDTITADNTGTTAQFTIADSINGGAGNDTVRVFVTSTTDVSTVPTSNITNVETLYVNGGTLKNGSTFDVSANAGITTVAVDSPAALADGDAFTFKATASQAVSLTNVKGTAAGTTSTINLNGATAATLNNVSTDVTLDLTSAGTALKLTATGAASTITLANTGANLATLTLAGDKALSITESLAALKTIDASGSTGGVTIDQSGIAANNDLKFTGGTGNDTVIFKAGALTNTDTLDGGAGTDVLRINDTTTINYAGINKAVNFETLSLGTDGATVDVSQVTALKNFSVDNAGTTKFTNATNANNFNINTSVDVTEVSIGNAVGQSTANVTLNNSASTAANHTVATLTLSGATTVNLASTNNGSVANTNTITTFANADNSNIVVTGNAGLTFTVAGTTTGSKVDASAFTGALNVTGSAKADILIGGSGADVIKTGGGADTLTGGAGVDKFDVSLSVNSGQTIDSTITDFSKGESITFANKGAETFTSAKVDVSTATTLDGAVTLAAAGDGGTNGLVKWFQYGGDTYVVNDQTNGAYAAATDFVVKLTGTLDLSTATFDATGNALTF
ncbi:beta strand repeat-containing protein [Aureimonas ureilytica]|uniref:beta strand repeat-containing protein n=1 Tax=Aureimonas ureilytica TaxID=401562 RepID=UPI00035C8581|nr:hypothetical protein [Aureimonas ureilytica]